MAFFPQSGQVGIRQMPRPMLSQAPVPGWNTKGSFMGQAQVQPAPAPAPAPQPPSPPALQPVAQPVPVPVPVAPPAPTTIVTTSGGPNMLALGVGLGALGLAIVLAATAGK